MGATMSYDAFLSYSSQDKAIANAMCHYLEHRGLRCWIAPRDVRPGEDYAAEIIEAITASRALVVIFSANANSSKHVKNEVERAVSHGVVVVPFRTEAVEPSKSMELFLGAKHWLDAMSPPLETHFDQLAVHLQFLAGREGSTSGSGAPATTAPPASGKSPPVAGPSRRFVLIHTMLVPVLFLAAAVIAVLVWRWFSTSHGGPPPRTAAVEPLHGSVDVLLWDPQDASRRGMGIRDVAARPIHRSDQIRVKVAMNRPSYIYLLWIGGDGKVAPVYPWRPGDWHNRPPQEQPIDRLCLPPELDRGWPMGGDAGMESIVLLVRDTPLPSNVDLENAVLGLQPQKLQSADALVEFEGGRPVTESMDHTRAPLFFDSQRIDDPLLQNQQLLAERLGRHFQFMSAISFANRGS
jgi:hypothetical protein